MTRSMQASLTAIGRQLNEDYQPTLAKPLPTELKDLVAFYQSPLGKKVLTKMPELTQQSAQLTQGKLETAVPVVNKLLADMTAELAPAQKAAPAPAKKP